jgi:hypothetical protein
LILKLKGKEIKKLFLIKKNSFLTFIQKNKMEEKKVEENTKWKNNYSDFFDLDHGFLAVPFGALGGDSR